MPKRKPKISQKVMLQAYEAAKSGKMSIRKAAKVYKIPKSTLIDKVKGKSSLVTKKGPKPILTPEEEKSLVEWGVRMAGIGFTCLKTQVPFSVKTILDREEKEGRGREKRFGDDNLPGKDWWGRFCENHAKLRKANDQVIERAKRQAMSDAAVGKWKSGLKKIYLRCNVNDPSCIFTCTIDRFQIDGRGVVGGCHLKKKIKDWIKYITVFTAASANGKFVPPMLVYPRDLMEDVLEEEAVEGTFFATSANGDMRVDLFTRWLSIHFADYIPEGKNILLLIEGNWPYMDMSLSKLCKEKNIILYCMPPRSRHFQSPLARGFSKQLPNEWKMEAMNFELLNPGLKVDNRYAFPAVFSNVWTHLASETHIKTAFESSGIWPLESKSTPRSPAVTDHVHVSCFDEEGNEIEVGMYEEVTSDLLQGCIEVSSESTEAAATTSMKMETGKTAEPAVSNVLEQFEKSQGITIEQREMFETWFLLNIEAPYDLIYNAWKALKELMVMKQDADDEDDEGKFEMKSDTEDDDECDDGNDDEDDDDLDDDDSLLDWLSDESDDDDIENQKENIQEQIKTLQKKIIDEKSKIGGNKKDDEHSKTVEEDKTRENDSDNHASSVSSDSSQEVEEEEEENLQRTSPRGASARTAMSPLKITRYMHPETAGKRKRMGSQKAKSAGTKQKSGGGRR